MFNYCDEEGCNFAVSFSNPCPGISPSEAGEISNHYPVVNSSTENFGTRRTSFPFVDLSHAFDRIYPFEGPSVSCEGLHEGHLRQEGRILKYFP